MQPSTSSRRRWLPWVLGGGAMALVVVLVSIAVVQLVGGPSGFAPPTGPVPPPRALPTPSTGAALTDELVARPGALFGALADRSANGSREPGLERLEGQLGRTLDIDRQYYGWDDPIPTEQERIDVARGRITLLSWKAVTHAGTAVSWASIASGSQDSWIEERAAAFRAFGHPIMLAFHHEPENDVDSNGTPAEFVAAWRHIHDVFAREGVTNVIWVVVLFAITYSRETVSQFYPGDDVVDWVGGDGYNFFGNYQGPQGGCRRPVWRSFSQVFAGMVGFARDHGRPAMVAEWGTPEDPAVPGRKAQWFRDALTAVKSSPEIKGLAYFDTDKTRSSGCDWRVNTTESSWDAFRAMALDPHLNVFGPPPG